MTSKPSIRKTLLTLAMTAAVVLGTGIVAHAWSDEPPPEDGSAQVAQGAAASACPCGYRAGAKADSGVACPGRNARRAGQGMQRGQGGGQGIDQEMGTGKGRGRGRGCAMGQGMGSGRGQGMGHGAGMQRGRGRSQGVMAATRALVHDYRQDIVRQVEDIENGVATTTRSPDNPEAVAALQRHVSEMKGVLEDGGRIRAWDPLFSELFDHSREIEMVVERLPDGVRVIETSANPEVVKLIRAHARKVSEFVARGPAAVHEPTPLPEDYRSGE